MNTRFLCACVFALALTLTLGPALPAGAAPAAGDHRPAPTFLTWLTDGLSDLGRLVVELAVTAADEEPASDDGSGGDAPVVLDDDGGEALRPERIGYGLTAVQ